MAALFFALSFAVSGCGLFGNSDPKDNYIEGSVEQLYNTGLDLLKKEEYKEATKYFNQIDRQHPYSTWATRSQLMLAYAHYKAQDYDTAVLTLNRFVRLHPGYRDIAYAYYLRGLCNFERVRDPKRDQTFTSESMKDFNLVARRYSTSKYAADARAKSLVLRDHLAAKEIEVGRFYQGRNRYLAAINRYKIVVERFQGSTYVPEALHRMTESYTALGLLSEARRTAAVLGHNYPSSRWYTDSYALVHGKRSKPVGKKNALLPGERAKGAPRPIRTAPPPPSAGAKKASGAETKAATAKDPSRPGWFRRQLKKVF